MRSVLLGRGEARWGEVPREIEDAIEQPDTAEVAVYLDAWQQSLESTIRPPALRTGRHTLSHQHGVVVDNRSGSAREANWSACNRIARWKRLA